MTGFNMEWNTGMKLFLKVNNNIKIIWRVFLFQQDKFLGNVQRFMEVYNA